MIGLVGRGGMGEVYRADDLRLGQPVALKFLPDAVASDPARLAQFHNEVRTARQVSHPNVCRVYDIGEIDGHLFLSMELVDGEDLTTTLGRIGRFPEDKALDVARQLCAGLAAAHERGVLHRDLKPANVMLDKAGKVRVMDFGLATIGAAEARARRHSGVHGAGAVARARRDGAQRYLRAWTGALRSVHRSPGVDRPDAQRFRSNSINTATRPSLPRS